MTAQPGTTPLYECSTAGDYFSSTDTACEGHTVVKQIGWIWTAPPPNVAASAEVYRCKTNSTGEYFDSMDSFCEGQTLDRSLGYLITQL